MTAAYKCDWCGDYFEHGFKGSWKKDIMQGNKQFNVALTVSKDSDLCKKFWVKFCKILYDDLRAAYNNITH